MHGPHSSHSLQLLRSDCQRRVVADCQGEERDSESLDSPDYHLPNLSVSSSTYSEMRTFPTEVRAIKLPGGPSNPATSNSVSKLLCSITASQSNLIREKRDAVAGGLPETADAEARFSQAGTSWRSAHDNPSKRQALEDKKFKEAIAFIRGQLEGGTATAAILHAKFNYPSCYDIEFLKSLAIEFKLDVSGVLAKKRAGQKELLNEIIIKLLS